MKRRFFPLGQEFRAIIYTASNSSQLICLSADGHSIWSFDALDGILNLVIGSSSSDKFTSIQMKNDVELLIGTFGGEIITKSLLNDSIINSKKYSEYPILSIHNENLFYDSQGKLFSNGKVILDDGILQPCRVLKSNEQLFFIKHSAIYIFDGRNDNFIMKLAVDEPVRVAELDQNDNLVICTDRSRLFTLDSLKLKEIDGKEEDEQADEQAAAAATDSSDSENEILDKSTTEQVFSLIKNPNAFELLLLKVDSVHKRVWFETVKITSSMNHNNITINPSETLQVACPLCDDNQQQTLPINTNSCSKGHPITICSQTNQLITIHCYKCRRCNCAFTTKPPTCPFCNSLITK